MKKWLLKVVSGLAVVAVLLNLMLVPSAQARVPEPGDETPPEQNSKAVSARACQLPQAAEAEELSGDELRKAVSLVLKDEDVHKLRRFLTVRGHTPQTGKATATRLSWRDEGERQQLVIVAVPFQTRADELSARIGAFIEEGKVKGALAVTRQGDVYTIEGGRIESASIKDAGVRPLGGPYPPFGCVQCSSNQDCGFDEICTYQCVGYDWDCLWVRCGSCAVNLACCLAGGGPWCCYAAVVACTGCGMCCNQWDYCCGPNPAP